MALNEVYYYSKEQVRERPVPTGTLPGAPLLINARPCVTITAAADATKVFGSPDGSSRTIPLRAPGQTTGSATVAFDGTWEFAVTGATTSTAQDIAVYITSGNTLTLTSTGNTLFGYTDYPTSYTKTAGRAPVRISKN